jgi:small subunit ribosomal protein S19
MSRSLKKGPFVDYFILKKISNIGLNKVNKPIKIWSRRSTITPEMVGLTFMVHNGRKFIPVYISETTVGHKFGEFSLTRFFGGHSKSEKTDNKFDKRK